MWAWWWEGGLCECTNVRSITNCAAQRRISKEKRAMPQFQLELSQIESQQLCVALLRRRTLRVMYVRDERKVDRFFRAGEHSRPKGDMHPLRWQPSSRVFATLHGSYLHTYIHTHLHTSIIPELFHETAARSATQHRVDVRTRGH